MELEDPAPLNQEHQTQQRLKQSVAHLSLSIDHELTGVAVVGKMERKFRIFVCVGLI